MRMNRTQRLGAEGLVLVVGLVAASGAASALAKGSRVVAGTVEASSKIAFISEPPVGGYCGIVYVINADGSGQRMLAKPDSPRVVEALRRTGCGQEGSPAWSPDGRRIAIVSNGIYVMNADGSGERKLTPNAGFEESPAWSPDGRRIAFVGHGDNNVSDLYVVNADGSGQKRLTRTAGVGSPAWSPDGARIAFVGRDGNSEIYVIRADGSGQRRLTHNAAHDDDPLWSPDGRRIAFVSNLEHVYVMNADGSGKRRLTRNGAHNFNPAWSPDGQRIAFERGNRTPCSWCPGARGFAVYVINADGSSLRRLTRGGSQPRWSPDGRKIAFVSKRDGNADIFVMNADGSAQQKLTRGSRRESQPAWSPAG